MLSLIHFLLGIIALLDRNASNAEMQLQIDLFEDHKNSDEESLPGVQGVDLSCPLDVFYAIQKQVSIGVWSTSSKHAPSNISSKLLLQILLLLLVVRKIF